MQAVRTLEYAWDPPPTISVGLSNVANAVPHERRPLINRTYCAMLMGVGLKMMIANPLDEKLKETIRVIEERDESTPVGRLYLKMADPHRSYGGAFIRCAGRAPAAVPGARASPRSPNGPSSIPAPCSATTPPRRSCGSSAPPAW